MSHHTHECVQHVAHMLGIRILGEHFKPEARLIRWGRDDDRHKFHEEINMPSSGLGRSNCGCQDRTNGNRGNLSLRGLQRIP